MVVNIGQNPSALGVVLKVIENPVNLVKLPFLVLVLHAQLVAVGLAYGSVLIRPAVPHVGSQLTYSVGLLLPNPEQLVNCALEEGLPDSDYGKLIPEVVSVHNTELLDCVSRCSVFPMRAHLKVSVRETVCEDVLDVLYKNAVCFTHDAQIITSELCKFNF